MSCSTRTALALLLTGAVLPATPLAAQGFESAGTRALGMAGAFVAVADDATATYWNPAGLATGGPASFVLDWQVGQAGPDDSVGDQGTFRHSTRFIGLSTYPLGLTFYRLDLRHAGPSGGSAVEAGAGREDRQPDGPAVGSLVTSHAGLTILQSLARGVVVGATAKYVRGVAASAPADAAAPVTERLDEASELPGRAQSRLDMDVGAMVSLNLLRIGFVVRNLGEPHFNTLEGDRLGLERQARLGLAVLPSSRWTAAVDADLTVTRTAAGLRRSLAVGVEHWLESGVGVRGGLRMQTVEEARPAASAGLSLAVRSRMWVEAQATVGGESSDRGWSLGTRLGY